MYNNYGMNPYYQPQRFQQPVQEPVQQYVQPQFSKPIGLQGKSVDSLEVVKATDVPFDGSISYFPLTDGTAIVTKQLQNDGTSKITVYKPAEQDKTVKFLTLDDLQDIEDQLTDIRKQLKDLRKKDE